MSKFTLFSIFVVGTFSFAASVYAQEGGPGGHPPFDMVRPLPGVLDIGPSPENLPGPCAKINLEKEQKAKLKEAYFRYREKQIDLESNMKKAHLAFEKVITSNDSDFKSAESASQGKIEAMSNLMRAKESYLNEVAFKILKPEQRQPAMACEMMIHHHGPHFEKQKPSAHADSAFDSKQENAMNDTDESDQHAQPGNE